MDKGPVPQTFFRRRPTPRRGVLKNLCAVAALPPMLRMFNTPIVGNAHAAIDPLTAITIAQTALGVIDGFTAKGDGGLSATLQAQLHYLELISRQVDTVIVALGEVQATLARLPEQMRAQNELDRMISYYDRIRSFGNAFREKFASEQGATARQLRALTVDYKRIADEIQIMRGSIGNYHSLIPAMAAPLTLAVEVAARRRSGEVMQIRPALDYYQTWVEGMIDPQMVDSIGQTTQAMLADHDEKVATLAAKLQGGASQDWVEATQRDYVLARCTRPRLWTAPADIMIQNEPGAYQQILVSVRHAGRIKLAARPNAARGIVELSVETLSPSYTAENASTCTTVETSSAWVWQPRESFPQTLDPAAYDPRSDLFDLIGRETGTAGGDAQAENEVAAIKLLVDDINNRRADISVYTQANMICYNVLTRVREHRSFL